MERLLNNNQCRIIFEFTPKFYKALYANDTTSLLFLDYLKNRGFKVIAVDPIGLEEKDYLSKVQIVLFADKD